MDFLGRGFRIPPSTIINFSDFPHVELEKYSPRHPQELKTAWILTRPPVYPADLLSPAVSRGGECNEALFGQAIG